jgi:hypothetical protein
MLKKSSSRYMKSSFGSPILSPDEKVTPFERSQHGSGWKWVLRGSSDQGLSPMALKLGTEPLYSTRSPREAVSTLEARIGLGQPSPRSSEPTIGPARVYFIHMQKKHS